MIIIIDYKIGNIGSIFNMFKRIGAEAKISSDLAEIEKADGLVLSGVGSFDQGIKNFRNAEFIRVVEHKVLKDKTPILGICLGMQLFAEKSEEGISAGLSWIGGEVKKIKGSAFRVPHMGWNTIDIKKKDAIFYGLEQSRFYFAHSYHFICKDKENELADTNYGCDFTSVVRKENIIGVQFHPEKSHKFGMKFLENFAKIC